MRFGSTPFQLFTLSALTMCIVTLATLRAKTEPIYNCDTDNWWIHPDIQKWNDGIKWFWDESFTIEDSAGCALWVDTDFYTGDLDKWWPEEFRSTSRVTIKDYFHAPEGSNMHIKARECGTPAYSPSYWSSSDKADCNDDIWTDVQGCNNCFNYAANKRTDHFNQIGMPTDITCSNVMAELPSIGFIPTSDPDSCPDGLSAIAVVVLTGLDFHFYRKDSGAYWSHKPGSAAATWYDSSDNLITDPATADISPYDDFCGYMCICSSQDQGKGYAPIF